MGPSAGQAGEFITRPKPIQASHEKRMVRCPRKESFDMFVYLGGEVLTFGAAGLLTVPGHSPTINHAWRRLSTGQRGSGLSPVTGLIRLRLEPASGWVKEGAHRGEWSVI